MKGDGNQQDYGMRIYDPRLGKFLSVDPFAHSYPFYSPYQFAGNDVIRAIDLDGAEPLSRTEDWGHKTSFLSGLTTYDIYDKAKNQVFSASGVIDPWTGKTWIVAEDGQGQNQHFYLVNDNKSTDRLMYYVQNGRTILYGGHFERFETRNETDAKQGNQIANGFSYMALGIVAAPAALEGLALLPSLGTTSATTKGVNILTDYGSQVAGNYIGGKRGEDAWISNINVTSLGLSALNPVGGLKSLAFNSVAGSAFSTTLGEGYNGLGGGKTLQTVSKESFVSFVAGSLTLGTGARTNQLSGRLSHANNLLGSNSTLSKTLQSTIKKTETVGATIGVVSGTAANAINQ